MPGHVGRRHGGLLIVTLALAGTAHAQPGLRPLSEVEILRRFADVRLGPPGQEMTRDFDSSGGFVELARLPLQGRYWASGSRLCTQILTVARAPSCHEALTDDQGTLYLREENGDLSKIVLEPNPS